MKQMNESQLLSWRPRRPSAGLRRRILKLAGQDELRSARWLLSAVAPTMACALLTVMVYNRDANGLDSKLPMTLILSNQNNAAYACGGGEIGQNHLAAITFDSTNSSGLGSSIRFTPIMTVTN